MNSVLESFYNGTLSSRYELESEIERYEEIIQEAEDNGVYEGDSYYQDDLHTLSALKDARDQFDEYYDSDCNYIYDEEETE